MKTIKQINRGIKKRTLLSAILLGTLAGFGSSAMAFPPQFPTYGSPIDRMDTDGDGLVSADEFNPPGFMRDRIDANDDGVVTRDELDAHIEEMTARMAERQAEMLDRIQTHFAESDVDGDGMVTEAEAQAAAFARIDADGDGYLSEEEFRAHRPEGRGGPGKMRRHMRGS